MKICLFLETSVFLGFIFPSDRWESAATICLSSTSKKFTSITVEQEIQKKMEYSIQKIQRELLGFLRTLKEKRDTDQIDEVRQRKLIDLSTNLKIGPFLKSMLSEIKLPITYHDFDIRVRDILHQFMAEIFSRNAIIRTRIDQMTIESWVRMDKYDAIQEQLIQFIPNDDDVRIILDAHDLAKNQKLNIIFVTGDWLHPIIL